MPRTDRHIGANPPLAIAAAIVILAGLFLGLRLQRGQPMNEDFAVYLKEAANIVQGKPVGDTGVIYVVDPQAALIGQGPSSYPPLLPLVLAPIVGLFGLNFMALKLAQLALLLAAFGLMAACRTRLGFSLTEACASIALFCVMPQTIWLIDEINSDLPFLLFLVVALLAVEAQLAAPPKRRIAMGILAGMAIFAAYDIRVVGVMLLPAEALAFAARDRLRVRAADLLLPGAIFAALWLVQTELIGQQSAYGFVMGHRFFGGLASLRTFYWYLLKPWDKTGIEPLAIATVMAVLALATLGVLDGMRKSRAAAWFCMAYFVMLLILPNFNVGVRYLVPIFLFLGAFAARGAGLAAAALRLERPWITISAAAAIVAPVILMAIVLPPPAALSYGALTPRSLEVFAYLQAHTERGALVAARKFRAFNLFTGRRTIHPTIAALSSRANYSDWLAANHVDYVVVKKSPAVASNDYSDCPRQPLCGPTPGGVERVFGNPDYQVFRLRPQGGVSMARWMQ